MNGDGAWFNGLVDPDARYTRPPTHWCDLPPIFDIALEGPTGMPVDGPRRHGVEYAAARRVLLHPLGTVWVCGHCGTGHVLDEIREILTGSVHVERHPEWRPENRRERRRRLRVPWYRRTP